MCCLLRYVDTKTMESVNDSDTMEDMIMFRQWSLQGVHPKDSEAIQYNVDESYIKNQDIILETNSSSGILCSPE